MAHPALATAVSASLRLFAANATENETVAEANASAAWQHEALEEAQRRITIYINTGIIVFWIVLLIVAWRKYRKATSAFVLLWLVWFGVKAVKTQQAVVDVGILASTALEKTRKTCIAIYRMFLSWGQLVAPAVTDLITLLTPAAIASWNFIVRFWNMSTWVQKGYFLLVLLVLAGVIFTVISMWRQMKKASERAKKSRKRAGEHVKSCKDILKFVIFQTSFLIIGPCIWWIVAALPGIFPSVLAMLAMSIYPLIQSLIVMKRLEVQKQDQQNAKKARKSRANGDNDSDVRAGAAFFEQWLDVKKKISEEDEEGAEETITDAELEQYELIKRTILDAREWLAFWSCWPIFYLFYWSIDTDFIVASEDKPKAYGLIVAMVLWVNIWGLKAVTAITPFFFAFLIVFVEIFSGWFFQHFFGLVGKGVNKVVVVKDQLIKDNAMDAAGLNPNALQDPQASAKAQAEAQQKKIIYAAGAVLVVLAVISFFFQAVAASTGILTFLIQWGMGIEAARRVKKTAKIAGGYNEKTGESFELIPHRLAFWVIQTIWVLLVAAMQFVWIDGFLSSFTPFIFGIVTWMGEDSVKYFLKMMVCVHSAVPHSIARLTISNKTSVLQTSLIPDAA